jgi:hypothetical protein
MIIDGRASWYKSINISDAYQNFDIPVRQALGDLNLVEVSRSIIVDRRPQQVSKIADIFGSHNLWRMCL